MTWKSLLLALLLLSAVFADKGSGGDGGDGGKGGDDHDDDSLDRTLTQESTTTRYTQFRSERKSSNTRERIRFFFGLGENGGELNVRVRYEFKNETADLEQKDQYSATFVSLDTVDTVGTLVSSLTFATAQWKPIVVTPIGQNFDVTAETLDGAVKVIGHVVAAISSVDGVPVRPTAIKFDVELQKTTTNYLRLNTRVFSSSKLESDDDSDEEREGFTRVKEKQVSFGTGVGFFSWAEYATLNGANVTIVNGALSPPNPDSEGEARGLRSQLSFTFQTADTGLLKWDPKIGVAVPTVSSASGMIASLLLLVAMFLFAL